MVPIPIDAARFYEKLIKNDFSIQTFTVTEDILLDDDIFDWEHRVVINVKFLGVVRINEVDIKTGLAFENCNFQKGIVFNNVRTSDFDSTYSIHNCNVILLNCSADYLNITGASCFERGFYIIKSEIKNLIERFVNKQKI